MLSQFVCFCEHRASTAQPRKGCAVNGLSDLSAGAPECISDSDRATNEHDRVGIYRYGQFMSSRATEVEPSIYSRVVSLQSKSQLSLK